MIIDVADPSNCWVAGRLAGTSALSTFGAAVSGPYAYVVDRFDGLQVIDVRDPAHCRRVGGCNTPGAALSVAVSGNYAFVADSFSGVQIIDVSDPTHCVQIGHCATLGNAYDVALAGNFAYVAEDSAGLGIFDVRDPALCQRLGGYNTSGRASGVSVSGNYAYVADGRQTARGVTVANGRIFLANGPDGLTVLPNLPNVHHGLRINAAPNLPFTLEATTALSDLSSWQPLLTTNVATMPFDFLDLDVKTSEKPQKFYRLRQAF